MAAQQPEQLEPRPFEVVSDGVRLAGEEVGEGPPIVLLHGLTATRRYVLHGSLTLARRGYRLISYDARGHGESSPAPEGEGYGYPQLMRDLGAVLADRCPGERPVLCGHSMGCHTVVGYALDHADEIAALVLAGPVTLGIPASDEVARLLGPARRRPGARRGRGVHGGLRGGPRRRSGMARDRAADHARAHGASPPSRGASPRRCTRSRDRLPSRGWPSSRRSTCRPWSLRATTRPIPGIRTRSPRPGPSGCPQPAWSAKSRESPRSPGRAAASPA